MFCRDDVSLLRMIAKIFLISDNFAYDSVSLRSFLIVEQITSASKATALDLQTCTYTQNKVLRHEDYRVRFWYPCRRAENSVPVLKSRNQWYNMDCIMSLAYGPIVKAYEENSHWKYGTLLFPVSGEGWCILLDTGKIWFQVNQFPLSPSPRRQGNRQSCAQCPGLLVFNR